MKKFLLIGFVFGLLLCAVVFLLWLAHEGYIDFLANQGPGIVSMEEGFSRIFLPVVVPVGVACFLAGIIATMLYFAFLPVQTIGSVVGVVKVKKVS